MPLHTNYRPEKLDDLIGNDAVKESLKANLEREEDQFHTFLFTGPSGCGKTTLARIVTKMLGCSDTDSYYINASDKRGIDVVRDVIDSSKFYPVSGKVKVYQFEECHQLTPQAQEALLKETEEPPDHVYYIFCTTEPEKLKKTFRRRAFVGEVGTLRRAEMLRLLKTVLEKEEIENFPDKVLSKIVSVSEGSPGIALAKLDSVVDITDDDLVIELLEADIISESSVINICQTLLDPKLNAKNKWAALQKILDPKALPQEPEVIRKGILTYLEKVMLGERSSPDVAAVIVCFCEPFHYSYRAGLILACYMACQAGEPNE